MKFIGITGGVGAGKSEILKFIRDHYKCKILYADKAAFEVRLPGTECYNRLCELLGEDVVKDRRAMAAKMFDNEKLLEQVNAIIHPAVKDYILDAYKKEEEKGEAELFFVEAALLVECGYCDIVDEMWYIYAPEEVRSLRLFNSRGYTPEKIKSIMASQLKEKEFRENCDFVIDNSGSLFAAAEQIRHRLEGYTWLK